MRTHNTVKPKKRRPVVAGRRRNAVSAAQDAVSATQDAVSATQDVVSATQDDAGVSDEEAPAVQSPQRRTRLVISLLIAALVFAGAGAWFTVQANRVEAPENLALVDAGLTAEVSGQVRAALQRLFTYHYAKPAETEQAANELLTGDAVGQYDEILEPIRDVAEKQQLEIRSAVVVSGVTMLSPDRANLLVFLDQNAARGDNGETSQGAAQLSVTATRDGDRWLISALHPR